MPLEPEFIALMDETVQFQVSSGVTNYGRQSGFTVGDPVNARIERVNRIVINSVGEKITAEGTIYCVYDRTLTPEDNVLVDGRSKNILTIDYLRNQDGDHHLEITYASGGDH